LYRSSFLRHCSADPPLLPSFPTRRSSDLRLYATRLATVTPHEVRVGHTLNDHVRHATREWLQLILTNNDILGHVAAQGGKYAQRSEEHTSELQSRENLVCRLLLEKKKQKA